VHVIVANDFDFFALGEPTDLWRDRRCGWSLMSDFCPLSVLYKIYDEYL